MPLLLVVLMLWLLPESVRYMVLRQQPAERIRKVLVRISHDARHASAFVLNEVRVGAAAATDAARKTGLVLILSREFLLGTLMMWLAYFMGLVIVYGLVNGMPVLFKDAGIAPARAAVTAACSSSTAWAPSSSGC